MGSGVVSVSAWHPQSVEDQSQTGEFGDLEEEIEDRGGKFQDVSEDEGQRGLNEQHQYESDRDVQHRTALILPVCRVSEVTDPQTDDHRDHLAHLSNRS